MSVPSSTYRLQLRPEFGFDDVAAVAPYLASLGVTHVYLSPHLQAVAGSTHGYDVVDHSRVNSELGGAEAHQRMCVALKQAGLGQIVDIVPNHMAIPGRANAWWWDVLKHGEQSEFATYFDVDWGAVFKDGSDKVLLPALGKRYGEALMGHELQVGVGDDGPVVRYFDSEFPITGLTDSDLADLDALNDDVHRLHELLEKQQYRLAYWRLAEEELEYRRFFNINSLMGLRSERVEVFEATHKLAAYWAADGVIDGLRVDHIDGLSDPAEYLNRLRAVLGPDGYLIVEKILEPGEALRPSWPVAGTTGYDSLRLIDGLFVDPDGEKALTETYGSFIESNKSWVETVAECKALVIDELFGSDLGRLTEQLRSICERRIETRDYSRLQLRTVLRSLVSSLDVYRTYVAPRSGYVAEDDERELQKALSSTKERLEVDQYALVDFVGELLTLQATGETEADFVARLQQLSGPVMAKGLEDTACYRYNRFVGLNEVGGDPGRFGVRPAQFHEEAAATQRAWPDTMIASTTHDTKRSEDVRYRLMLLSEMAEQWRDAVAQWSDINDKHRRADPGDVSQMWPDRNTEYLIYQTLVGAHPISDERLNDYVLKATREARVYTTWQSNNVAYEQAVSAFVRAISSDADFLSAFGAFVKPLVGLGYVNSLAATTLRLTMPGVPDTFQGSELWNLSLVDPDNRRAVDYDKRAELLEALNRTEALPVIDDSGAAKLWLMQKLLHLRQRRPGSFDSAGDYAPVASVGERAANVMAYRRNEVVVVVPRLLVSLEADWRGTSLAMPDGDWRNVLDGRGYSADNVDLGELLVDWPVAVLETSGSNA